MSNYSYVAVDTRGVESRGTLDVTSQIEAIQRIKQMGLFPTRVIESGSRSRSAVHSRPLPNKKHSNTHWLRGRVKPRLLTAATRQLATLVEAGMPLLRSLRLLAEQENSRALSQVIAKVALSIESGSSLTDALSEHPRIFDRLYLNMVRAGEVSGALELSLKRLAEFMEKAQKIKGRVKSAMIYPFAVLTVATGILILLMVYVVPKFKEVFDGLLNGAAMPAFTMFVLRLSEAVKTHFVWMAIGGAFFYAVFLLALKTVWGRRCFDAFKLVMPILGPVFRKSAISRFSRTFGTLLGSGVPMLQALTIVKETAGNVTVGAVVSRLHDNVKEGDTLAPTLKASGIFPSVIAGMVDVGEQTGALPEMLIKVADNCDEEVDNAVNAMTSLLEPIMIVILAIIVGSIVIALFLPLIVIMQDPGFSGNSDR
jgi:type IV pilus assembly protein PilC